MARWSETNLSIQPQPIHDDEDRRPLPTVPAIESLLDGMAIDAEEAAKSNSNRLRDLNRANQRTDNDEERL